MQQRLIELHQQRGRLLERIATQRGELALQVEPLGRMFELGERVAGLAREVRAFALRHPVAVAAAAGALVLLRPRAVLRWSGRGLLAWRTWRSVRPLLPDWLVNRFRRRR